MDPDSPAVVPHAKLDDVEDIVSPAGKFRIYLGSVAGVGKTCAMLDEGWRRHDRGADVVVGFVETHGRPKTAEMIKDLEVIARKKVHYRDSEFEEMDLDAILARAPDVVLIDEIAHTNVPTSSRHEKRWEDVLEILDAGIAVISTLNVQHIESLADAVESITGVKVRERVPDWVVRRADQVELIDSSPEQLRRRMLHGNIYPAERVADALAGFFQMSNLTALREIALRFVADETEEDLLAYLKDRTTGHIWETTERVLFVATGESAEDAALRRAARYAARLKTALEVLLISENERTASLAAHFAGLRHTADSIGAVVTEQLTDDLVATVMELAERHQITQLVLAAPPKSMFGGLRRNSPLVRLLPLAATAGVDVHLITASRAEAVPPTN